MKNNNILNEISNEGAKKILRILADEDEKISEKIERLAEEFFATVDFLKISNAVFHELNWLDVEVLWDNSGKTRYGYVEPDDKAYDMVEQVLNEYIFEYDKYIRLNKRRPAMEYMIGIISGIIEFDLNGNSEFKDWAIDVTDCFIRDYIEKFKNDKENAELIDEFMQRIDAFMGEDIDEDILCEF